MDRTVSHRRDWPALWSVGMSGRATVVHYRTGSSRQYRKSRRLCNNQLEASASAVGPAEGLDAICAGVGLWGG